MPPDQRTQTPPRASNGADESARLDAANRYGNAFLLSEAPDHRLPQVGMPAADAMRLLGEELVLDGIPMRNLATFVTTWMEPHARTLMAETMDKNMIDKDEYPHEAFHH